MAENEWLFTYEQVKAALPPASEAMRFAYAHRHGTMRLGLYAPRLDDIQTPHRQDELYFVATGSGVFVKAGERRRFDTGDAIFVEAGAEHRFEDFTGDFAAWVIFWGPDGGEAPAA